jgi:hypothetical protein
MTSLSRRCCNKIVWFLTNMDTEHNKWAWLKYSAGQIQPAGLRLPTIGLDPTKFACYFRNFAIIGLRYVLNLDLGLNKWKILWPIVLFNRVFLKPSLSVHWSITIHVEGPMLKTFRFSGQKISFSNILCSNFTVTK